MRKYLFLAGMLFFSLAIFSLTYYSKAAGNLNTLATWGTNINGTGAAPANFTTAGCTYIIVNNAAPTIAANWVVSGAGSKIQVGDGIQIINFTIPAANTVTGTVDVLNLSTLTVMSANAPTLGTLSVGSTVVYSRSGNQTIFNASYDNITLSGTGTKSLANTSNTVINNVLTINAAIAFRLNTNNTLNCSLNGTVSGAGTITGGANAVLKIGGTGNLGTLIPTGASQILYSLTLNRSALGIITLGGAFTTSNSFTFTNGILSLNGNTFTIGGTATFPVTAANGTITGSANSSLSITASAITNSLFLTAGAQTLKNLTLNCGAQTLKLGSDVTVSGAYTQTRGILNLNGNTLTLNGTATFASSAGNGTTTGSATSNLLINASTITNSFFMAAGSQTLNNLTVNSAGQNFTMGTGITVSGAYNHTKGIVRLNGQALTLNGTVTFPVASANGTTTGTNASDLLISASSISNNLVFTAGGLALRNFTINSPGQTLTLGTSLTVSGAFTHSSGTLGINGNTLTLNGAITFPTTFANGNFSGSTTSAISIGGAGAITNSLYMLQVGTSNYLNNFTLNRAAQTVTLGNTLNLVGTLTPTAGVFASGGNLILIATSSTVVARIATIGASGSVTGNVTAQMYAKGGTTGWTTLGSPGLTGRTFTDWDDNTTITCANCPDGFWYSFTSVTWYDETVGGLYNNAARYKNIANIFDAMTIGKGFWVYLGTASSVTADIILDATGPVNQGNFALNLTRTNIGGGTNATDHGYNLISNPYPSPISWTLLRNGNGNVGNAIYAYNPDLAGFASFVGGVSSPAVGSGGIGNMIPAGQAFYVKANAAAAAVTAKETNKAASAQELLKMGGQQTNSSANPMVMRLKVNGHSMKNETAIYFDANATSGYDNEYDALYMGPDAGYVGIGTRLTGTDYIINGLPALNQNYGIPVFVTTDTTDVYSIAATDLQNLPGGACIMLHDNYTGIDQDLRNGSYACTISDTEKIAARFILNITVNSNLTVNGNFLNPTCNRSTDGYLTASATSAGPWNYYWKDANNTIIKTSLNKTTADTLFNVNAGNYSVDVNTAGSCDNGTKTFTLNGTSSTVASYNPSASSVVFITDSVPVSFTNTSSNANTYWWDFGDGMGGPDTSVTHQFTAPGDYLVTLTSYNAACGDTSVYSQIITVVDGSAVGIAAVAQPAQNMFISRDTEGYYAQFNYKNATSAVINVTNLLGEKVIADLKEENVSSKKVHIPLGDNANTILIISVITETGEKTFCKIVNY